MAVKRALVALLLAALSVSAWSTYRWKQKHDQLTDVSASYLFGPSGVVDAQGRDLSRHQLIDLYLHEVVEKNPQVGWTFKH